MARLSSPKHLAEPFGRPVHDLDLVADGDVLREIRALLKRPAPQARHFCFPRPVEHALTREAARRNVHPQTLAVALIGRILADDMVDAVIDGETIDRFNFPTVTDAAALTPSQCAFVYCAALHAGPDGMVTLKFSDFGRLFGVTAMHVSAMRDRLEAAGLVGVPRGRSGRPVTFGLTEAGWRIARTLAGADLQLGGQG